MKSNIKKVLFAVAVVLLFALPVIGVAMIALLVGSTSFFGFLIISTAAVMYATKSVLGALGFIALCALIRKIYLDAKVSDLAAGKGDFTIINEHVRRKQAQWAAGNESAPQANL
jgi:hypothetical protein